MEKGADEQRVLEAYAHDIAPKGAKLELHGWHKEAIASVDAHYQIRIRSAALLPALHQALQESGWEQCGLRYYANFLPGTQERYRKGETSLRLHIPPGDPVSSFDVSFYGQIPPPIC